MATKMATKTMKRARLGLASTALSGSLAILFGAGAAHALDQGALPQGGTVVGGAATIAQSGRTLTVNQSSDRTVIDWRSFDIGSGAQANFNQPGSGSIAVNRVNASANPTQIQGGLHANGQVWILNPNGVLFGKTARVDVAGIVASTANLDAARFMAGDNRLTFAGSGRGAVVNEGSISVAANGLAAFVAPSVRNSGSITAKVGKVALAAGDTFTLDLAGDRLVELGLGSGAAVVDQSGHIVNEGGTVTLSAATAGQVVDSVINMSGVISTASARQVGGRIVLEGDAVSVTGALDASGTSGGQIAASGKTLAVAAGSSLKADAGANGDGGAITLVAFNSGDYAGSYSARGGSVSGNGGAIETSGKTVRIADGISVDTQAPYGATGSWTIDPDNLTVGASGTGTISGGLNSDADQTISASTVSTALNANNVTLQANTAITVNSAISTGSSHSLYLKDENADGQLTVNLNAPITVHALAGDANIVNVANTANIQNGIDAATSGGTVNVANGTYVIPGSGYLLINNKSLSLIGQSQAGVIIDARHANTYGLRVTAPVSAPVSNVVLRNLTVYGVTTGTGYGIKIEGVDHLTLSNLTSQGAAKSEFDLNGVRGATLGNLLADGAPVGGGANTGGNGVSITDSQDVTLTNVTTQNNAWGGLAIYQTNNTNGFPYQVNNITVDGTNTFNELNPIYLEDQSSTNNYGALNLAGVPYLVKAPGNPADVYTWFQKTQQGAIDLAAATSPSVATVQSYGGTGSAGDNNYIVGFSTGGQALSIQAAINAAQTGATVNVNNGTYVIPNTTPYLGITKSLSLVGQSQTGTIIDAHAASQYGLRVTADNVSLSNFTLLGVTAAGNSYGIKVENNTDPSPNARINNFSISNVTSHGARKAQLDMNGVVGATIDHFTADGTSNGFGSGSQAGAGIAITDSANVTITNSKTNNNAYGGVALQQSNTARNQQVTGVTIAANNQFSESVPLYAEDTSTSNDFGALSIGGFPYIIRPSTNPADVVTVFQPTQQAAIDYASSVAPSTAWIQAVDGATDDA